MELPKTISRKNLRVDIDYEMGLIEILGWWVEKKIRGERPRKACVVQELSIDLEWVQEQQHSSTDLSLYDLVMELEGNRLTLSLPKIPLNDSDSSHENEDGYLRRSPTKTESNHFVDSDNDTRFVARNLWKMVRGLARLNSSFHNTTLFGADSSLPRHRTSIQHGNETTITYFQSRQEALERFLRFSLGATDEESHWLKRM